MDVGPTASSTTVVVHYRFEPIEVFEFLLVFASGRSVSIRHSLRLYIGRAKDALRSGPRLPPTSPFPFASCSMPITRISVVSPLDEALSAKETVALQVHLCVPQQRERTVSPRRFPLNKFTMPQRGAVHHASNAEPWTSSRSIVTTPIRRRASSCSSQEV